MELGVSISIEEDLQSLLDFGKETHSDLSGSFVVSKKILNSKN